ncbi:MAG TPA: Ig-like domain-containing protein, partial [Longimicrobium sp.]|uniref:Ig-like domain-containing protein n=1 Tax=Longimicrobium sp. TaxID=2029185 RepID=UPI002EDB9EFE
GGGTSGPDTRVARVDVTAAAASMEAGASVQLSAVARNAAGEAVGGTFTWSSSNTATASVGAGGMVQGATPGSATISATEAGSGIVGSLAVTVTPAAVQSVTVAPGAQTVIAGRTQALTATLRDARGAVLTGRAVTWSSANPAVASVDASGVVTGVAPGAGAVAITATSEGQSGSAQVTVVPVPIATLTITPAGPHTLVQGGSITLGVVARDADGNVLTGRALTWSSANPSVASVSGTGVVSAAAVGGPVTLTAASEGVSTTVQVTVIPVPVASVTVSPASATIPQGLTQQFTATARDAGGNVLTGRAVAWSSLNAGVVTVSASGLATGGATGSTSIVATVEGRSASVTVFVTPRTATSLVVNPRFTVVNVGQTANVAAAASDASGVIPSPATTWVSANTGTATVNGSGQVLGVAAGVTRVSAQVNSVSDTSFTAVLASNSMLSTAFTGGQVRADIRAGTTITFPVTLDMSRVSATGDLGAVQFEFRYDPTLLEFQSGQGGLTGNVEIHSPTPGTVRFAYAGTAAQGSANLTLATLSFRVLPTAATGRYSNVILTYTAPPTSTTFQSYGMPVAMWGRLSVVAP